MGIKLLLAAALLAVGVPTPAQAQEGLPAEWDQKVAAAVQDPARAGKVVEAGRRYDARRRESVDSVRSADAKVREIFLDPKSTSADRGISIGVFRVARRKALMASVDVLFELKALVSKKEWNAIWPKGYFDLVPPPPLLAEKVPSAIPAVVSDPARQKQATDVAAALVKAAKSNAALRDKARSRLEKNLAEYGAPRDEFIDSLNDLEERQTKAEDALVDDASQLREILTPDEWRALVSRLTGVPPPAPKQAKAPGSDRDEHGCIGSAGYSWCAREKACVRPWELAKEKGLGSGEEAFRAYCSAPPPR